MDCSMPGFPVHHQLLELAHIHVHRIGDAIQPSHPLSSPSPSPSILLSTRVFSNESVLHIRWSKYWSFSFTSVLPVNIQDWFPLGLTGLISLLSKGLSGVFSSTTVPRHQFFGALPSLRSISHPTYVTAGKTIAWLCRLLGASNVSAFQYTV